jgi:hypothetical protein
MAFSEMTTGAVANVKTPVPSAFTISILRDER